MRPSIFLAILVVVSGELFSQVPAAFNYQAIARDSFGNTLDNRNISVRFTIDKGVNPGVVQYTEIQYATTNGLGLFTTQIGFGTPTYGTFAGINWSAGDIYLVVEYDPNGGTDFYNMGATQLLSVPYALYAGSSLNDTVTSGSPNGWILTGNSQTTYGTNFIGTSDSQSLMFKVNNIKSGFIENTLGNTGLGFSTFLNNSTGINNTALGAQTLFNNVSGNANIAVGVSALYNSNTESFNVSVGDSSLFSNGIGAVKPGDASQNTAVGSKSLFSNLNGAANTSVGFQSLYSNTSGSNNTSFGTTALYANITGAYNTAVGATALLGNMTGSYNTSIGYSAYNEDGSYDNCTCVGYSSFVDSSNEVRIGNTSVASIGGQVGWTTYSDARIKNNVTENVPGLDFLKKLRPVTYHYDIAKEERLMGKKPNTDNWKGKNDLEKITFTGFLAQEVDAAAKETNYDFSGVDKTGSIWGVRYADFVPSLVKGIQEQQSLIEKQQTLIDNLQKELDVLKNKVNAQSSQFTVHSSR